mgnify:CR=1 FL=1
MAEEEPDKDELTAREKVAILMIALGQETTAEVMKYLADFEIEQIAEAISELEVVTTEQEDEVLEEFEQMLIAGKYVSQGGMDFARGALEKAMGPRKAQDLLDRVNSTTTSGFYMLRNVDPNQIIPFIAKEHPQTIALILSQLESAQAAGILSQLPERLQADVAYRLATMENITPNVIKEIEEALEQSLRDMLGGDQDVGGPKVVADVLNLTGSSVEKAVLDQMDAQDPEVAESVRNLMFVFADIVKLTDREIQTLLREVDQKDLVVALKSAEEELKEKVGEAEIVKLAQGKADVIVGDSERKADRIITTAEAEGSLRRDGADKYARETLFDLEERLASLLGQVRKGIDVLGMEVETNGSTSQTAPPRQ